MTGPSSPRRSSVTWCRAVEPPSRIKAGRPTSNGCVERAQLTILEECWRPAVARALAPKSTALEQDLEQYLWIYNFDTAHTGRLTHGRVPGEIVYGARKMGAAG